MPEIPTTQEDWLACLSVPDYVAMIPTGKIKPIVGPIIWTDGTGKQMFADEYKAKWGFDPQVAWDAITEYRSQNLPKKKVTFIVGQ